MLKRAKLTAHHTISREELSVREHMTGILRRLQCRASSSSPSCFDRSTRPACRWWWSISSRMLELAKETLIEITQAEPFAPIYVRLAYSPR